MISNAKTPEEFLQGLPEDRRTALGAVRKVILANLPPGYEEQMQCGMISYVVPHSLYPAGYHCKPSEPLAYASIGSQKNHMTLYLMTVYGDSEIAIWFKEAYAAAGKKLDMGQCCVRFKTLEDLPLPVVGQAIARVPVQAYIKRIEQVLQRQPQKRPRPAKKPAKSALASRTANSGK